MNPIDDAAKFAAGLSDLDLQTLGSFGPGPVPVPDLAVLYDWFEDRGADRGLAAFGLACHRAAESELARRASLRAA